MHPTNANGFAFSLAIIVVLWLAFEIALALA